LEDFIIQLAKVFLLAAVLVEIVPIKLFLMIVLLYSLK